MKKLGLEEKDLEKLKMTLKLKAKTKSAFPDPCQRLQKALQFLATGSGYVHGKALEFERIFDEISKGLQNYAVQVRCFLDSRPDLQTHRV